MRKLYIIGIGAGNPDYITLQAVKTLQLVDVFFFMDKGQVKGDLIQMRREVCERHITDHPYRVVEATDPVRDDAIADYTARVEHWHQQRVLLYEELLESELGQDQCGAILVWGDPCLYDSTLRIVDQIVARGKVPLEYEVIPGITSIQALAASHRISLNGIGESVLITTGRKLAQGIPAGIERVVVMLDGQCAFQAIPQAGLDICWGAYLGMEEESLISGNLAEVASEIEETRSRERSRKGWIMDTYLLSPTGGNEESS